MRNPVTMSAYEDLRTGLTPERTGDLQSWVRGVLTDTSLTPDQREHSLALGAAKVLPHLPYSEAATADLADGTICMLGEIPLPCWPRYIAPDYARLLQNGSAFLKLKPARDLHDALTALICVYQYSATVTLEPVFVGNLDTLLEPYIHTVPLAEAKRALKSFWTMVSRLYPSSFVHANFGPTETVVGRMLLEMDLEAGDEPINTSFRYDPAVTPPAFAELAARSAMVLSKPYFHNHAMSAADWGGEAYAIASCYNLMRIGGGIHTLVRLNLGKVAEKANSAAEMLDRVLPEHAALLCEVVGLRSQFLGAESGFFTSSWLVKEGLLSLEKFTAYAGMFALAEAVNTLMAKEGRPEARYGQDTEANQLAARIMARLAECVASHPLPFCEGTGGRACLHAQVGIDSDKGYTPAARIPSHDEPELYEHLRIVAPHDRYLPGGVSNIFEFEETAADNPQAILDIVKGAFSLGIRNLALGPSNGELIRVTGYLMRRSDVNKVLTHSEAVRGDGGLFGTGVVVNRPEHFDRRLRTV